MLTKRICGTFVSGAMGVLLLCIATSVQAADTVRFVVRSFIPKTHPTQPGAIKPVPGQQGLFMLPDVLPTGSCFDTDHREFSADPMASARLTTDISIVLTNPIQVKPSTGGIAHRAGVTIKRNCADGSEQKKATANVDSCSIGAPASADNKVQVVLGCSAGNPLVSGAPNIDYGGTLTYDRVAKTLAFRATIGEFPAFEAYASLNGMPFKKIFALGPALGSTPWSLFDAGLGFKSRPIEGVPVRLD